MLAGRGGGKTRAAAEDTSEYCRTHPNHRVALVCETFGDGRDTCIEGESGLLSVVPPSVIENWNRSLGELVFVNGSRVDIYSSEKPGQLRGPQHHRAWCAEWAKWRNLHDTWNNLRFGLRLGDNPQTVIETTPKPLQLLKDIKARRGTITTSWSTFRNRANLADAALEEYQLLYEGTQIGRQELYAEILDDYEGALWNRDNLDEYRLTAAEYAPVGVHRVGLGLDPSTWGPEFGEQHESIGQGIETGIVATAIGPAPPGWLPPEGWRDDARLMRAPHVYVIADLSQRASPLAWAKATANGYHRLKAGGVVVEKNNAGWVGSILRGADNTMRLFPVQARLGKRIRAEPVAALYEQGRAHHVGDYPDLENQQCGWDPSENWSPDRIDAAVHAITWLAPWKSRGGVSVSSAGRTI
jgi:phage terminase large subunit-like protein